MRTVFILLALILFAGCANQNETVSSKKNAVSVTHAKHFDLTEVDSTIQLHLFDPESGKLQKTLVIEKQKVYRIISLISTTNGAISALKGSDHIIGISNGNYLHDKEILALFQSGKIKEYGFEGEQSLEQLLKSKANVILYSGFGDKFPHEDQLEKMGILVIPVYDWRENDPLGKAEWIKVMGALLHKQKEANAYFEDVKKSYESLRKRLTSNSKGKTVLVGNLTNDIWFTPAGDSYGARLLEDAGAAYVYSETMGTGSLSYSMEKILIDNQKTDIWINPGFSTKKEILRANPNAKHLTCLNNCYGYEPNLNDYWERSAIRPDLVLSDLIDIFHPELQVKGGNFYSEIN